MEKPVFHRSLAAHGAASSIVRAARECHLLEGGVNTAPELAEMEKQLFVALFREVEKRFGGRCELAHDEVGSMFNFVFARAAEAVSCLIAGNRRKFDFDFLGLFDGKAPLYADDRIAGYFKTLDFPVRCAESFLDYQALESPDDGDPLLSLFEALKWCFRFSCHAALCRIAAAGK